MLSITKIILVLFNVNPLVEANLHMARQNKSPIQGTGFILPCPDLSGVRAHMHHREQRSQRIPTIVLCPPVENPSGKYGRDTSQAPDNGVMGALVRGSRGVWYCQENF